MKHKSKRCSTGHGTGVLMPAPLSRQLRRWPRLKTRAVLNAREIEARERAELRQQRRRGAMMAKLHEAMARYQRMRRIAG